MTLAFEIKRKAFHHLALGYLVFYAIAGRTVSLIVFGIALFAVTAFETLRLRRPELNAAILARFRGIHRESEVMNFSGIFWALLGVWTTMAAFTNSKIVLTALGFLVFGDAAASLGGKRWGRRPWAWNAIKTWEGTACFAAVGTLWALLFVKWPVALLAASVTAVSESRRLPLNDNFWIPVLGGAALSVFNLILGR